MLRTAWANPPEIVAKLIAISGDDIVARQGDRAREGDRRGAAGSPFAADYAAGQGGLMVPAAALGIASALVMPALAELFGASGDDGGDPNAREVDPGVCRDQSRVIPDLKPSRPPLQVCARSWSWCAAASGRRCGRPIGARRVVAAGSCTSDASRS